METIGMISMTLFSTVMIRKLGVGGDSRYSAYALLGPQYCPLAFSSNTNF